jgi:hypothetical protein
MLDRSAQSAGAARARNSRARRKLGVRIYRLRAHERRLSAALRLADPSLPVGQLSPATIERELESIIEAFTARWLGPKK